MADLSLRFLLLGEDKTASKAIKGVGQSAHSTGQKVGLGVAAIGTAAVAFAKVSVDKFQQVGTETLKLKRYLGGTTEEASRFRYAGKMSGLGADQMANSLGKLSKTLVAAQDKTKSMNYHVGVATGAWHKVTTTIKDASGHFVTVTKMMPIMAMKTLSRTVTTVNPLIAQLGFKVRDAAGHMLPMSVLMPKIADKFKSMPAGAEKSALALKLFGKQGMSMIPMLDKGSAGIKALGVESDKFGNTLNDKDTAAVKENTKQKRQMAAAMEGLQIMLGRVLMPVVVMFTTKLAELARWFNQNVKVMGPLLAIVGVFIGIIYTVTQAMKAWAAVQAVLNLVMDANPIGLVILAIAALIGIIVLIATKTTWFQTIWQYTSHAIGAAWTWLWNTVLQPVAKLILTMWGTIATSIGRVLQALGHVPGFGWAKTAGDFMVKAGTAAQTLANNLKKIPDRKNVRIDLSINALASNMTQALSHNIGIRAVRAAGGPVAKGSAYIVGEHRPEVFVPDQNGTILPRVGVPGSGGSGGTAGSQPLVVQMMLDGRVVHQSLLALKRTTGGGLGLESA